MSEIEIYGLLCMLLVGVSNFDLSEPFRCSPLSCFAFQATCGHMQICKILIENGAELLALNADGNMPYDICDDDKTLDYIETQMDRIGITQDMIDKSRSHVESQMLGDLQALVRSKSSSSPSVDDPLAYRNDEGATPLHIASAHGYQTVVEYLLQQRVSINLQDADGWTAIHAASFWCQQAVLSRRQTNRRREHQHHAPCAGLLFLSCSTIASSRSRHLREATRWSFSARSL